jgi:hypothetical protein
MKLLILFGLLITSGIAAAQEREFYGGIGGGGTNFESSPTDIALPVDPATTVTAVVDDSDSNLRFYGGYRLNRNLAFEALYSNIGEFELIDDTNNFELTNELNSVDLAVVGLLPLWEGRVDLIARAGLAFWSLDSEVKAIEGAAGSPSFIAEPESSGQDLFWSVGFNLNFFDEKRWTFRSELTTYEIGDVEDVTQFAFNIHYRF